LDPKSHRGSAKDIDLQYLNQPEPESTASEVVFLAVMTPTSLSASQAETLIDRAHAAGLVAEDWTANIQPLCKACSEGRVEHDHTGSTESTTRLIGLAARSESTAKHFIDTALGSLPNVAASLRDVVRNVGS
jgi:hypothetical protein